MTGRAVSTALEVAANGAQMGVAVLDEHGFVVQTNPAFYRLLGVDAATTSNVSLASLIAASCPLPAGDLAALLERAGATTLYLRPPHGAPLVLHLSAGGTLRVAMLEAAENLPSSWLVAHHADWIDPLTGLGDRALFDELIANWVQVEANVPTLAAVVMNLDGFKQVNESLGRDTGDEILKLAANRIRAAASPSDVAIRFGGDDFVVVQTSGSQPASAEKLASRLVELLARPFLARGQQINIGASVGVAIVGHGTATSNELLTHANLALREAKSGERGTFRLFDPELESRAHARHELEIDLRRALALKELSLFYQPQLRLADNRICGFEALMRWHHPQRGWVSPTDFIPIAEKIGEIDALGTWALHTACRDAMQWPSDYGVAVNVSPIQFASDDLVEAVRSALVASGLAAERLEVEITEGVLLHDTAAAMDRLAAIKALGVSIAMDDFGTGYSSLGYLTRFPFSKIKIDQSFLRGEQTPRSRALVQGILRIGELLGMTTIAEGVETEEQLAELAAHGCLQVQGYLVSRPLSLDATMTFIAAREMQNQGASLRGTDK